jgi:hypothetical protein
VKVEDGDDRAKVKVEDSDDDDEEQDWWLR